MTSVTTPLELTDMRIMLMLGHVLWSWPLCSNCSARRACASNDCASHVLKSKRYFRFYKGLIETYVEEGFEATRALKTHEDVFAAIRTLQLDPRITRKQLADSLSATHNVPVSSIPAAICLAVKVLTMVDSSSSRFFSSPGALELGRFRTPWRDYVPLCDYIQDLFPKRSQSSELNSDRFLDMTSALRASKLKKKLKLTLRLTHDLRDHLQFDRKHKILDIFHMTTFLKEQLRCSKGDAITSDSETESSDHSASDIIPRQLLLETLSSIQQILFPPFDQRSRHLLRTLIHTADCDPDAARYESASVRDDVNGGRLEYVYLAERLEDLYEEMQNPPPDGWLDRVLERKSGRRHVMCITIAGFVVALLCCWGWDRWWRGYFRRWWRIWHGSIPDLPLQAALPLQAVLPLLYLYVLFRYV